MKLIDADELKNKLSEMEDEYRAKLNENCNDDPFSDGILSALFTVYQVINEQPKTYDIEKVVEELESYRDEITCDIDIDKAIKIVKQGCVDKVCNNCIHKADNYDATDDFCEWEKLNDCKEIYSTGCGNFCSYRPKSINCKYCGKKIRVVE